MENFIPKMLTIKETAKAFNLSVNFVRNCCLKDEIVFVKAGSKFLINANLFAKWLNGETVGVNIDEKQSK